VRSYIITTQGTQYESDQLRKFLDRLSPNLKEKVAIHIFTDTVLKNYALRSAIKRLAYDKLGGV